MRPTRLQLIMANVPALEVYVELQREWSLRTFGEGLRTGGVCNHIREELKEIEENPTDLVEWTDVIILAIDGYWRAGGKPAELMAMLEAKQDKNFLRVFQKPVDENTPSFHTKGIYD